MAEAMLFSFESLASLLLTDSREWPGGEQAPDLPAGASRVGDMECVYVCVLTKSELRLVL